MERVFKALVILLLLCQTFWALAGAQNIITRVQPPESQERLCPDQTVVFQCNIPQGIFALTWVFAGEQDGLLFEAADTNTNPLNSSDGKFSAFITGREPVNGSVSRFIITSTLRVRPPLLSLNGTAVECVVNVVGDSIRETIYITLSGFPSPPGELKVMQGNKSSISLQWTESTYSGNENITENYRITISEIKYSMEVDNTEVCSNQTCSYTLSASENGMEFNTTYLVVVTAVNTCGLESNSTLNVAILAYPPPPLNLAPPTLQCSDVGKRRVNFSWTDGLAPGVGYTPPTGNITLEVNGSSPAGNCSGLTPGDTRCSLTLSEDGRNSVRVNQTNKIGTTVNYLPFLLHPLIVLDNLDAADDDVKSPSINVTLNELCLPDSQFSVTVAFGKQLSDGKCDLLTTNQMENITPGVSVQFSPDADAKSLLSDAKDYCYVVNLTADGVFVYSVTSERQTGGNSMRTPGPVLIIVGVVVPVVVVLIVVVVGVIIFIWATCACNKEPIATSIEGVRYDPNKRSVESSYTTDPEEMRSLAARQETSEGESKPKKRSQGNVQHTRSTDSTTGEKASPHFLPENPSELAETAYSLAPSGISAMGDPSDNSAPPLPRVALGYEEVDLHNDNSTWSSSKPSNKSSLKKSDKPDLLAHQVLATTGDGVSGRAVADGGTCISHTAAAQDGQQLATGGEAFYDVVTLDKCKQPTEQPPPKPKRSHTQIENGDLYAKPVPKRHRKKKKSREKAKAERSNSDATNDVTKAYTNGPSDVVYDLPTSLKLGSGFDREDDSPCTETVNGVQYAILEKGPSGGKPLPPSIITAPYAQIQNPST